MRGVERCNGAAWIEDDREREMKREQCRGQGRNEGEEEGKEGESERVRVIIDAQKANRDTKHQTEVKHVNKAKVCT